MRIAPMFRMYLEHITRRRDGHFQTGCPLIPGSQLLRLLSQFSTVRSTNTQATVLRSTVPSSLTAGEAQAAEEALMIFGTLLQLKPPSSHSRRASE